MNRDINLGQFLIFLSLIFLGVSIFFTAFVIANKIDDVIIAAQTITASIGV